MNRWLAKYLEPPKRALPKLTKPMGDVLASGNVSIVSPPIEHFEINSSQSEQQGKNLELPNNLTDKTNNTGFGSSVSLPLVSSELFLHDFPLQKNLVTPKSATDKTARTISG